MFQLVQKLMNVKQTLIAWAKEYSLLDPSREVENAKEKLIRMPNMLSYDPHKFKLSY